MTPKNTAFKAALVAFLLLGAFVPTHSKATSALTLQQTIPGKILKDGKMTSLEVASTCESNFGGIYTIKPADTLTAIASEVFQDSNGDVSFTKNFTAPFGKITGVVEKNPDSIAFHNDFCITPNPFTSKCSCPSGYKTRLLLDPSFVTAIYSGGEHSSEATYQTNYLPRALYCYKK